MIKKIKMWLCAKLGHEWVVADRMDYSTREVTYVCKRCGEITKISSSRF